MKMLASISIPSDCLEYLVPVSVPNIHNSHSYWIELKQGDWYTWIKL